MTGSGPPLLDLHHLGNRQTGNESWARGVARELFRLDGPESYDVAVSASAPPEDLALLAPRASVVVTGSSSRRLAVELPRAMRRLSSSAVLVQYTSPLSRVPAVVVVHDLSFEDPRAREWLPPATRLRYRATIRASVRRAAHVLTVSEFSRRDLLDRYGLQPERVTVAPNAVDPAFVARLQETPEAREHRHTVLLVGNVLPRKNVGTVARAVRLLRDRRKDVVLRVVGTVPAAGQAEAKVVRALLGDAVEFTGYVSRQQLAQELRSAHVLAFPSLFEGFGIPVLEAMAAGLPVVASDCAALPEVAGDAGLMVPGERVSAWADALWQVSDASTASDLRTRGYVRCAQYSWAQSAVEVSRVLATVALC